MTSRVRPASLPIALLAAAVLAGCGVARVIENSPDDLAAWSETPLPPDPNLAAMVRSGHSACSSGEDDEVVQILLQDRRTPQTAAFLVAGADSFGSCIITSGGGMSSGGSGPRPGPMTGALSIDDNGGGGAGEEDVRELGGRVSPRAARVVIHLTDGRAVLASVGNGYWLAWWPDTARAERVIATDAAGVEIASSEVVE